MLFYCKFPLSVIWNSSLIRQSFAVHQTMYRSLYDRSLLCSWWVRNDGSKWSVTRISLSSLGIGYFDFFDRCYNGWWYLQAIKGLCCGANYGITNSYHDYLVHHLNILLEIRICCKKPRKQYTFLRPLHMCYIRTRMQFKSSKKLGFRFTFNI